jgi:hypothetical protein
MQWTNRFPVLREIVVAFTCSCKCFIEHDFRETIGALLGDSGALAEGGYHGEAGEFAGGHELDESSGIVVFCDREFFWG